jgi:hypothetical protein
MKKKVQHVKEVRQIQTSLIFSDELTRHWDAHPEKTKGYL